MDHEWIMHGECDCMGKKSIAMYLDHAWKYMVREQCLHEDTRWFAKPFFLRFEWIETYHETL